MLGANEARFARYSLAMCIMYCKSEARLSMVIVTVCLTVGENFLDLD